MRYPDFLRHIVSAKLAEYSRDKAVVGMIDEVRKMIAKAEEKYNFSSFGGNPENLAKYLRSKDFKLLVSIFKSANKLDVLKEILYEAKKSYSELPSIVKAIDEVLPAMDIEEKSLSIDGIVEILKKEFPRASINIENNDVHLKLNNIELQVKKNGSTFHITGSIRFRYTASSVDELTEYIKSLIEARVSIGAPRIERNNIL